MAFGAALGYRRIMPSATFDTHEAVKALSEAGLNERQAEAITATVRDAVTEGVATKADIADVRADLAALEARLTWRIVTIAVAVAGVAIAVLKML